MKGIVFSFKRFKKYEEHSKIRRFADASAFFRRYGATILFLAFLAVGLACGSAVAKNSSTDMLRSLDFLFTTNLESRLGKPMFTTFAACFVSNFIFLLFVFLCGLSPWGMAAMPVSPLFKGFGTGLSAGYLFITYGFKGIGFYLLIILPGTFLFCFALTVECLQAHYLSYKVARAVFSGGETVQGVSVYVRSYLFRSLYMLLLSAAAALLDMLLWSAFSGLFFG